MKKTLSVILSAMTLFMGPRIGPTGIRCLSRSVWLRIIVNWFGSASLTRQRTEDKTAQPIRVEVVKVIQLTAQQFRHFSANLLRDMPFIAANRDFSGYDKGVTRCLLVTTRSNRDGILVNSEGYNYARYAAYVRDKRSLDLRDVPVDHYDLKPRQPRSQQER